MKNMTKAPKAWLRKETRTALRNRAAWHREQGREFAARALEEEAKKCASR